MHIAFVASECVPFSKTGGLADVVGALPRALAAAGHQVSVYIPHYRHTGSAESAPWFRASPSLLMIDYRFCSIVTGRRQDPECVFTSSTIRRFSIEKRLYGTASGDFPDNAERFALFSRAVLEASKILGVPDVFHCHDWQTALVPVLLRTQYAEDPAFRDVGHRIHHPQHGLSGIVSAGNSAAAHAALGSVHHREDGIFRQCQLSEGRAGLFRLRHHREQKIQPGNSDGGIRVRTGRCAGGPRATVTGILNGVDYDEWNPQTDKFIAATVLAEDLSGKAKCKQDLLAAFGVQEADT